MSMRPATIDVQKIPAPRSSPTMSSGLPLDAAANDAKMSGQPLPNANKVTPFSSSRTGQSVELINVLIVRVGIILDTYG